MAIRKRGSGSSAPVEGGGSVDPVIISRVQNLESSRTGLETGLNDLSNRLPETELKVSTLETLTGEIASNRLPAVEQSISTIEQTTSELSSAVVSLEEEIPAQTARIAQLESMGSSLNNSVGTLASRVTVIEQAPPGGVSLTTGGIYTGSSFGITGGAAKDETANINAAIVACGQAGGGEVIIRSTNGTDPIYINGLVTVAYSNVSLVFKSPVHYGAGGNMRVIGALGSSSAMTANHGQTDNVTVLNASGFATGDYALVSDDRTEADLMAPVTTNLTNPAVMEIVRVSKVDGNTIYFERPLRRTYLSSRNATVQKMNPVKNSHVVMGDLIWTALQSARGNYGVTTQYAVGCTIRVKNAYGKDGRYAPALRLSYSYDCHILDSGIYEAARYDSGEAYGVVLTYSTLCSARNCSASGQRHSYLLQTTTSCDVLDCVSNDDWISGIDLHGAGAIGTRVMRNRISRSSNYAPSVSSGGGIRNGNTSHTIGDHDTLISQNIIEGYSGPLCSAIDIAPSSNGVIIRDNQIIDCLIGVRHYKVGSAINANQFSDRIVIDSNSFTRVASPLSIKNYSNSAWQEVVLTNNRSVENSVHFLIEDVPKVLASNNQIIAPVASANPAFEFKNIAALQAFGNYSGNTAIGIRATGCGVARIVRNFLADSTTPLVQSTNTTLVDRDNTDVVAPGGGGEVTLPLTVPKNNLIAALGDSITAAVSNLSAGIENYGYLGNALRMSGQRFVHRLSDNYGVGGNTTLQMKDRVASVIASGVGTCIVMGGTNDRGSANLSQEQTMQNLKDIRDQLIEGGVFVVLVIPLPRGDTTFTNNRLATSRLGDHLAIRKRLLVEGPKTGCVVVDPWPLVAEPTSVNGDIKLGYTHDGLHPNTRGSYFVGKAIAEQALTKILPSIDILPMSNTDVYHATENSLGHLNTNPKMLGTGGATGTGGSGELAEGWSGTNASGTVGVTRTYSKVTNERGLWQQCVIGGDAATANSAIDIGRQLGFHAGLVPGREYEIVGEYEIDAGSANVLSLQLGIVITNSGGTITLWDGDRYTNESPLSGEAEYGVLRTPRVVCPANPTDARIRLSCYLSTNGAPSATIRFRNLAFQPVI